MSATDRLATAFRAALARDVPLEDEAAAGLIVAAASPSPAPPPRRILAPWSVSTS